MSQKTKKPRNKNHNKETKSYKTVDFGHGSKAEKLASRKFTDCMRIANGYVWTPEVERLCDKNDDAGLRALLNLPNLSKL